MRIAFHSNQVSLRGTEVALYDYAHFAERLLGHKALIVFPAQAVKAPEVLEKFKQRFPVYLYEDWSEVDTHLQENGVDVLYMIKAGKDDGRVSSVARTVVHAVFKYHEPHGDRYAYISRWLAEEMQGPEGAHVPHMVHLPVLKGEDLRSELQIPASARVFGRYGGWETFDLPFVKRVLYKVARKRSDVYFLFMNTAPVYEGWYKSKKLDRAQRQLFPRRTLPNIIHLEGTQDMERKARFVHSCDAMLHARQQGESFGLACGEFSVANKAVLTYTPQHRENYESNHIEILGDKGIYYGNASELKSLLLDFEPRPEENYDAYSQEFSPRVVMAKFKEVFLD